MTELAQLVSFIKIVLSYYTLQLGRGAAVSFFLMALILLLRQLCRKTVFLKGLLWSMLLLSPFAGRLKYFYELSFIPSGLWNRLCMQFSLVCGLLYLTGCLVTLAHICRQRRQVYSLVSEMRKERVLGTEIYVCESPITPFTSGIFSPRLVFPAFMLEQYDDKDLEVILLHEKAHILLGHLLFYLIWDAFRVIFWINPLFILCLKYFKEDMEDICDRVTIRKSRCSARAYGSLLLKSICELLGKADEGTSAVTFFGDRQYQALKRRIKQVTRYREYRRISVCGMAAFAAILFFAGTALISSLSYARYETNESIELYNAAGTKLLLEDSKELHSVISFDDSQLYIRSDQLKSALERRGIDEEGYTVSFGGYFKLPGFGGGFCCAFIDSEMLNAPLAQIPYNKAESPYLQIFLML